MQYFLCGLPQVSYCTCSIDACPGRQQAQHDRKDRFERNRRCTRIA